MKDWYDGTGHVRSSDRNDYTPGNSYGSLGYALRLDIELEPVRRYVALRHVRFDDAVETTPPRLAQDPAYLLDCTKARTEFGWEPERSVEDVIRETIDWLRKNLDRL